MKKHETFQNTLSDSFTRIQMSDSCYSKLKLKLNGLNINNIKKTKSENTIFESYISNLLNHKQKNSKFVPHKKKSNETLNFFFNIKTIQIFLFFLYKIIIKMNTMYIKNTFFTFE